MSINRKLGRYGGVLAALSMAAVPVSGQSRAPAQAKTTAAPAAVTINQIEENPAQYKDKVVKVSGEVQEVLGPRMFTIDESEWIDLDGETLVIVPAPLAALVNEDAPVTVTGTVRIGVMTDLEREWGWFGMNPRLEAEFTKRPMIVADSVTNTQDGMVLAVRMTTAAGTKTGTARTSDNGSTMPDNGNDHRQPTSKLTDLAKLAGSTDEKMVGDRAELQNARVAAVAKDGGFWVSAGQDRLFVLPAEAGATKVTVGQTVGVKGVVLQIPDGMRDKLGDRTMVDGEQIYVYADQVTDTR